MNKTVHWLLELEIQSGQQDELPGLMSEMVESTQSNEPGTLNYEWSTSADGKRCHLYERYADSAAAMQHLGNFGSKFAGRFMEVLKPIRFVVYGSPDENVKNALAAFNPDYMQDAGGFTR